jgi:outer membrane protein OmpA-like peptidoglycan-associated protein
MLSNKHLVAGAVSIVALLSAGCAPTPPPPPAPPPSPPPIAGETSVAERALLTEAADAAFPSGGYTLSPQGQADLGRIVPALQAMPSGKVVVYGYTDNVPVGPDLQRQGIVDNLDLSSKRANEVVRYLASQGVNPAIMSSKGRGETHPVASNDTPEGRAQNRRIEVVVEQPYAAAPVSTTCPEGFVLSHGECYPAPGGPVRPGKTER